MKAGFLAVWLTLMLITSVQAKKLTCHLHVPVDMDEFKTFPAIIPDLGDVADCERENAERLGSRGRCHCTFSGAGFRQYIPADRAIENGQPGWLQ